MTTNSRVVLIGADGLRPDLLDPEIMPNVAKLAAGGTTFAQHRCMYPSHTRVNMTTLATGTTAGQHGIVANTMLVPNATPDHIIQTADYLQLDALDAADPAGAQMTMTFSEAIHANGKRFGITGNGSAGSGVLWSYRNRSRLVHTHSAFGIADLYDLREKLGDIPEDRVPRVDRNDYCTRAVTDIFLPDSDVIAMTVWYSEPDAAFHYYGLGSPEAKVAMRSVDDGVGRILDKLDELGIRDQTNILFLSDHGHTTVRAHKTLREFLEEARAELGDRLPPLATASDFIYTVPGNTEPRPEELAPLVEWLQAQPWVDLVLGNDEMAANIPGVLALTKLWGGFTNHRRPLLAVSPAWNDDPDQFGVPGTIAGLTTQAALRTSHGSLARWDMQPTLIGHGPAFREGVRSEVPTGAIDIAPTVMHLLGMPALDQPTGRVLAEGLIDGNPDVDSRFWQLGPETGDNGGRTVTLAKVNGATYIMGSDQALLESTR